MTAAQRLDAIEARLADLEGEIAAAVAGLECAFSAGRASITHPHEAPSVPQPRRHLTVVTR